MPFCEEYENVLELSKNVFVVGLLVVVVRKLFQTDEEIK